MASAAVEGRWFRAPMHTYANNPTQPHPHISGAKTPFSMAYRCDASDRMAYFNVTSYAHNEQKFQAVIESTDYEIPRILLI